MKTKYLLVHSAVLGVALTCVTACQSDTYAVHTDYPAQSYNNPGVYRPVAFRDSAEAKMLMDAYAILATGDHDYNGHRVGAMQQVRSAAELLGVTMAGDSVGAKPQPLSDERLREAKGLIVKVLDSAEVKGQQPVVKRLNESVHQINMALGIK